GPPPLGHGPPYARAAAAVPPGAGRDGQDAAGWDARRRGLGHESAGLGRGVAGRSISLSVGGRTVFSLGVMCVGLPSVVDPWALRGTLPVECRLYCEPVDQLVGRTSPDQADV